MALAGGPGGLVTGNIPYNITSPLLDKALTPPRPRRIVFLVQKEVAHRVGAAPGHQGIRRADGRDPGGREDRGLFTVPAGAFQPVPKVDSAALRLEPLAASAGARRRTSGASARPWSDLFGFRRKQLVRAVRELTGWGAEHARARGRAGRAGRRRVRPEVLSPGGVPAPARGAR